MSDKEKTGTGDKPTKGGEHALLIKLLIGLCAVLAAAVIVAVVAIVVISLEKRNEEIKADRRAFTTNTDMMKGTAGKVPPTKPSVSVCDTPHCKRTAKRIEDLMDRKVRPCDDFYEFACGRWVQNTIIDPARSLETYYTQVNPVKNRSREVLEMPADSNNLEALKKAKAFYKSCMDLVKTLTESIEKAGLNPLKEAFRENLLEFPLLGIDGKHAMFEKTVASYAKAGLSSYISLSITKDSKKSQGKILQLQLKDLTKFYRKTEYTDPKKIELLRTYFLNLTTAISGKTPSEVNAMVENIVNYEIGAAKLWYDPGTTPLRKDTQKRLTLKELKREFTNRFDVVSAVLESVKSAGVMITEDDFVTIKDYKKLLRLGEYIASFSDKGLLKNILGLKAVQSFLPFLPKELRQIEDVFNFQYFGTRPKPRWEACVEQRLDYATTRLFADKYFPLKDKLSTDELVMTIKAAAQMMLVLNQWMDLPTKKAALDKIGAMGVGTAYPSWIFNDTELNRYYSKITVWKSKILKSFIGYKKVKFVQGMRDFNTPEYKLWWMSPLYVNAYNSENWNSFFLLVGILQPPFFDINYPMAMKFGGIGHTVAHEISHGFDANGRHRDKNGDFKNWWTDKSSENYDKKVSCIVDQYGGYVHEQINKTLQSNLTKSEDISDTMGLHITYKAYRSWADNQGREEDRLPGLEFTPNQLLFINYAHTFCDKARTSMVLIRHAISPHNFGRFRVNGVVESYKGFVDAFNCPVGSPMNLGKKCKFW